MSLDRRLFTGKLQSAVVYPEFFPLDSSMRVINLGCGVGPQVAVYAGNFAEMVCVDIMEDRLRQLDVFMQERGVGSYKTVCAKVEATGLHSNEFDRALCIDIIEHVHDPRVFLQEIHRVLRPGGKALITIPIMHDHWVHWIRAVRQLVTRKRTQVLPEGHPDRHNIELSRADWLKIFSKSDMKLSCVRATTLFPPLHLYGIPRFWFTVFFVHILDRLLCQIPVIRRLGQSWMCILEKPHQFPVH